MSKIISNDQKKKKCCKNCRYCEERSEGFLGLSNYYVCLRKENCEDKNVSDSIFRVEMAKCYRRVNLTSSCNLFADKDTGFKY